MNYSYKLLCSGGKSRHDLYNGILGKREYWRWGNKHEWKRQKKSKNRLGGGVVLLYVKNNIKALHKTDLENDECGVV